MKAAWKLAIAVVLLAVLAYALNAFFVQHGQTSQTPVTYPTLPTSPPAPPPASSATTTASTSVATTSAASQSCTNSSFISINRTISCYPAILELVDVGEGEQAYQIPNAIVDIYFGNVLEYTNMSMLQNDTPYSVQLYNGHNLQVYVHQALWSYYPYGRGANITLVYK